MTRLVTLAVCCVLTAVAPAAAPVPKHLMPNDPPYYPTRVGARWVYRIGDDEFDYAVTGVEAQKDGSKVVTVGVLPGVTQRILVTGDGLTVLADKADQPARRILSTRPGVEWTTRENMPVPPKGAEPWQREEVTVTHTSHRPERVVTPAGTFNAIRIEVAFTLAGREQRNTRWYAPGVGLVKDECNGAPGMVLKSFAPGKE